MKRSFVAFIVLLVSVLCGCSPSTSDAKPAASPATVATATVAAKSPAEMEQMIIEREKKSWEPVKNQSPEDAKRFNAPGFRALYFGLIKGEEESANDNKDIVLKSISFSDWKVSFPVPNTAIVTYKYEAVSSYKGKDTSGPAIATSTWVNIGDEWKLAVYAEARAAQESKK